MDVRVILAAICYLLPIMMKLSSRYALIANGGINNYPQMAALIKEYPYIIAVDGGLIHCDSMAIIPNLIIGDFDSVSSKLIQKYRYVLIKKFPEFKDESDLELALKIINHPKIEKITLFGALEKRLDHSLANLHLIRRFPSKVYIETETEVIWAFNQSFEMACRPGQIISFMPLGKPAIGVSSIGLKWELHKATLDKYFFSLSNVCLNNTLKITLGEGDLICCLQK